MWLYLVFDTLKLQQPAYNCELHETGWIKIPQNVNNIIFIQKKIYSMLATTSIFLTFLIQSNQVSIAQLYSACSCAQATPNMQIQLSIKRDMREKSRALRRRKWSRLNIYKLEILCVKFEAWDGKLWEDLKGLTKILMLKFERLEENWTKVVGVLILK